MAPTLLRASRQVFSIGDVNNFNFTESLSLIKELLDRKFWIFKVTTLTQVVMDESALEHLKVKLIERIPGCTSASLTILNNHGYMPDSLKVKVNFNSPTPYECVFASVACQENRNIGDQLLKLPILCVLSGLSMVGIVHSAFESTFGCIMSPISVQKVNTRWFIAISINEHFRRDLVTEFSLIYKVKNDMKISCNLPFGELNHFWTQCVHSNLNKLDLMEVNAFIDKSQIFFEGTYGIAVSWFEIISVVLTETRISFENMVEIQSNLASLLYCILSFIESDLTS